MLPLAPAPPGGTARRLGAILLALVFAGCGPSDAERPTIRFSLPADGFASLHIKAADGRIVRTLAIAAPFEKGAHEIVWDGLDEQKQTLPPGEYVWSGAMHTGIRAELRGWACADFETPWPGAEGTQIQGGDAGAPSAVAADGERVYLGWSGAIFGTAVLACDLDGKPLWGWPGPRRPGAPVAVTGAKALAVDADVLTMLGGKGRTEADATQLFKLDARTGTPIPWPENRELTISSLWPADAKTRPDRADGMAARAGRIYLTFTKDQFLAVLDAQTGAYLQTVVGAPPELIDVVPTKTESADKPGELMAADFAFISLRGGVIGKVLFAHDPLWVVVSDMQPLDREERISALTVVGDGAKHHPHSAFVGLDAPFHQVQRRSVLQTEGFLWTAGRAGGRQPGPWVPEALGPIRGVALDARGRLWVAEGDAAPPRFSVWKTDGTEGRLMHEFFGPPPQSSRGTAVFPGDPDIFVGAGCEWRLDPKTGEMRCTGLITREGVRFLRFQQTADGRSELAITHDNLETSIFERVGEGRYDLRRRGKDGDLASVRFYEEELEGVRCGEAMLPANAGKVRFIERYWSVDAVGTGDLVLARLFEEPSVIADGPKLRDPRPPKLIPGSDLTHVGVGDFPRITQTLDGRVYAAARGAGLMNMEITGLDSLRSLPGGKLIIREPTRKP